MKHRKFSTLILSGLGALAAVIACGFTGGTVYADGATETGLALSPVEVDSEIAYHYFDAPNTVFADDLGLLVAGDSLEKIAAGTHAVTKRDVRADKVARYHTGNSEYIILLSDGVLSVADGDAVYSDMFVVDFVVDGNKLYAVGDDALAVMDLTPTEFDASTVTTVALDTGIYPTTCVNKITVTGGEIFVSADADSKKKQDVYSVDADGTMTRVLRQSDSILSLASLRCGTETVVYTLTRDKLTGYVRTNGGGFTAKYTADDEQMCDIYGYGDCLYGLTAINSIRTISSDLSKFETKIASADDSNGFFYMPSSASVKNSRLYVADGMNGRVAVYGSELTYVDRQFDQPSSVVCDSGNALYVAHESNKIATINGKEYSETSVDGEIKQMVASADKRLYILADSGLWMMNTATANAPKRISDKRYKAIALSVGHDELYAMTDTKILKLVRNDEAAELGDMIDEFDYCDAEPSAFSFAVDLGGNVFMLSKDNIYRRAKVGASMALTTFPLELNGSPYSLGLADGQIILNTVGNSFVDYGDAIIVDTYKHRVFAANGGADGLAVKLVDEAYDVPDLKSDDTPRIYDGENDARIIRTTLYTVEVFEKPMESPSVYTIAAGRKVIVPEYDIADAQEFSLILIDDLDPSEGDLIQGYVYKDALSEPLVYDEPPASVGAVYAGATPVYMWPSRKAKTVKGYSAIEQNTELGVLSFVKSYRDEYDIAWYRVSFGDNGQYDGYIMANSLSLMGYDPHLIRPAYDAEIISYKNSAFAQTYRLENGDMVAIEGLTLPTGTQVEIVGKFDSSEPYTEVKYLDAELGTLTCYVKTEYVKYNGVNVMLIVAVVVIIVTVILAAIIIGRVVYLKKKRLITPNA